jgi:hypothetical protein
MRLCHRLRSWPRRPHKPRAFAVGSAGRWPQPIRALVLPASGLLALWAVTACGSSPHSGANVGSKITQDCTAVSDVLSDGPDPDADSVGYAQAQVLPLRQLKISAANLRTAVNNLDDAYQQFSSSTGTAQDAAGVKVSSAQTALNNICPGVAP